MILDSYKTLGGIHPETNCVKNILAYQDMKAPHTRPSTLLKP